MPALSLPSLHAGEGREKGSKKDADGPPGVPAALRGGVSLRGHDDDGDVIRSYRNAREFERILVGRY
jgi:hypothetical protein